MLGGRTIGQPAASASIEAMVRAGAPHAILLAGPRGTGKTTLALDLATALLCTSDQSARPCRACRACRLVEDGNHPDLHRLTPDGAGGQIRIEHVRALVPALALHAVEGGQRVAIVERADRMNDDAQNALLKTLEEPPSGVTLVLCADDEDRLLPTIRSRVSRVRLGLVSVREIETLLAERGLAQPPMAARIARAANGRPGRAVAYATTPDALSARSEAARTIVDLVAAPPFRRLEVARDLLAAASSAAGAFEGAGPAALAPVPDAGQEPGRAGANRIPAAERRRGLAWLIDVWTDVARDLVLAGLGDPTRLRDPSLLDDLAPIAGLVPAADAAAFLERIAETGRRLEANVSPELALDVLVLAWPRVADAA